MGALRPQATRRAASRMSAGTFVRLRGWRLFRPTAWDWREFFGGVLDHAGLLIASEQEDSVALMFESEGGEDFAGDAEIGVAEMGALSGFGSESAMRRNVAGFM